MKTETLLPIEKARALATQLETTARDVEREQAIYREVDRARNALRRVDRMVRARPDAQRTLDGLTRNARFASTELGAAVCAALRAALADEVPTEGAVARVQTAIATLRKNLRGAEDRRQVERTLAAAEAHLAEPTYWTNGALIHEMSSLPQNETMIVRATRALANAARNAVQVDKSLATLTQALEEL